MEHNTSKENETKSFAVAFFYRIIYLFILFIYIVYLGTPVVEVFKHWLILLQTNNVIPLNSSTHKNIPHTEIYCNNMYVFTTVYKNYHFFKTLLKIVCKFMFVLFEEKKRSH